MVARKDDKVGKIVTLKRGDMSAIARELGISRQAVDCVIRGKGRSERVELAIASRVADTPHNLFGFQKIRGKKPNKDSRYMALAENLEWANCEIERLRDCIKQVMTDDSQPHRPA